MIFDNDIILEDSAVILRPIVPSDKDSFRSIFFDPPLWEYTVSKVTTEAELDNFITESKTNITNKVRRAFAIVDKLSGEIAGTSSYGNFSETDRCVEIGWSYLGRKFWGSHVNSHAKFLLLQYAFEQMNMNRVEFKTDDANPRSGRALIKIGCTKEGVLRSKNLLHNGRMRDTAYYSILISEWPTVKERFLSLLDT
jgi:RimJ/RimL family protein N-acetyltransferase